MDRILSNLQEDIRLSEKLFTEDRVIESYFLLKNIEQYSESLTSECQDIIDAQLLQSPTVTKIRVEGEKTASLLSLFEDNTEWNTWNSGVGINHDVVVSISNREERGEYFFKVEGRVNTDVIPSMAALLENELYEHWMPLCSGSKTLKSLSPYRRIVRSEFDFALLKRQAIYNAHGDILPDGGLLLSLNSLSAEDEAELLSGYLPHKKDVPLQPAAERLQITGGFLVYPERVEVPKEDAEATILKTPVKLPSTVSNTTDSAFAAGRLNAPLAEAKAKDRQRILSRQPSIMSAQFLNRTNTEKHLDAYIKVPSHFHAGNSNIAGCNPEREDHGTNPLLASRNSALVANHVKPGDKGDANSVVKNGVYVRGIFKMDPRVGIVPDWIFNMAVRSAISMIIPMMEHQALLFEPGGIFHPRLLANQALYDEIKARLDELEQKQLKQQQKQ